MIDFARPSEAMHIAAGKTGLSGLLQLAPVARGIVLYTREGGATHASRHGDGLGNALHHAGIATLLLEPQNPKTTGSEGKGFDIAQRGAQLTAAADWLAAEPGTKQYSIGLLVTGREAAAALTLAARRPELIAAVVAYGARPDIAGPDTLARVRAPTLLIVGEEDGAIIELNRLALDQLGGEKDLAVIRGATLARGERAPSREVARLATRWFSGYFGGDAVPAARIRV
jgi:putative phosphoribosyl transferase